MSSKQGERTGSSLVHMNNLGKLMISAVAAMLAASGFSQTFYHGDKNILEPTSNMAQAGRMHTNYLINLQKSRFGLLSTLLMGHTPPRMFAIGNGGIQPFGPNPDAGAGGYTPQQIRLGYNIPDRLGTKAIAIVDAYDNPTALADFNTFSQSFGLPTEPSADATNSSNKVFQVVYQDGIQPASDPGWAGEIALDIEWAHAMAPNAKIYLVEAQDNSDNLYSTVQLASTLTDVREVSMSWGGGEWPGEVQADSTFTSPNVVYFAASGDSGAGTIYPCVSPNVVGVGGTSLVLDGAGNFVQEFAWMGSGGGPSNYEPLPAYQSILQGSIGSNRGAPDISGPADPYYGCAVFSSYAFGGWAVIGGTSWACPTEAGIANARGQFSTTTNAELTRLYQEYSVASTYVSLYRDITQGSSGWNAGPGYDFATGIGSAVNLYQSVPSNLNYAPISVTPIFGSVVSPTTEAAQVSALASVDQNSFVMSSAPYFKIGTASGFQTNYQVALPISQYKQMFISANVSSTKSNTYMIYFWNYTTGQYNVLTQFSGTGVATNYKFQVPTASMANYIDPNGNVQVLFVSEVPRRKIQPVNTQTSTDMININMGT